MPVLASVTGSIRVKVEFPYFTDHLKATTPEFPSQVHMEPVVPATLTAKELRRCSLLWRREIAYVSDDSGSGTVLENVDVEANILVVGSSGLHKRLVEHWDYCRNQVL